MKTSSISASVCRWIARIIGTLLAVMFIIVMVVAIRQMGWRNLLTDPRLGLSRVGQMGAALLVVSLLAGWRREFLGGVLSLVALGVIFPAARAYGKITWFYGFLCVPGLFYISSHFLRSYASRHATTQPPAGPGV